MDIKDWRMDVGTFSRDTSSGGTSNPLPAVDVTDNGKVLGVVNGSWSKMDVPTSGGGSGGGSLDVVIANATYVELEGTYLDKKFADIAGKCCFIKYVYELGYGTQVKWSFVMQCEQTEANGSMSYYVVDSEQNVFSAFSPTDYLLCTDL